MSRINDFRKYGPGQVGVDAIAADTSTDGNIISTAGKDTATFFFEFAGDASDTGTTGVSWQVVAGREGSTTEYRLTSVALSSGAGTWSKRAETFSFAATGDSENWAARYDVADFDWIKIKSVVGTGTPDSNSTITVYLHTGAD